jgi:hypothetical protein
MSTVRYSRYYPRIDKNVGFWLVDDDITYCTLRLTLPTAPYGEHYILYLTVDITYCTLRLTLPTVPYC